MADDTTVINEPGFQPEPVPDSLAEVELNGLQPDEESTDDQQVEVEQAEPTQVDDSEEQSEDESDTDSTQDEDDAETTEEVVAPTTKQADETEELTGAARRLAQKAERDYIKEQRQQIREYEQSSDTTDVEERMKILEAKQYVDTVERNRQAVATDVARAQEIPFFKSGTEQSQLLFQQSLENFANAYGVTDPETGEWIAAQDRNGNEVQLLPYLQQQAATYEQALADSQRAVQKTEAKMRAKAVNPSNTGKVTSSGNELDDLLDKIGDVQLAG